MPQQTVIPPNRDPDIILPREEGFMRVFIWIEENVFAIDTIDNAYNHIKSGNVKYSTPIEYLEHTSNSLTHPKRAAIAATYILEHAINRNDNIT
jgi:hypothetical protein